MTYTVWAITPGGVTTVATDVDADTADSISRHPSLSASTVAILPSWADAPVADR